NDSTVAGATMGFSWDNPAMQLDSAVAAPLVISGFEIGPFFYEQGGLALTNTGQRFLFGGSKKIGQGVPGSGSGSRLWGTFYFTLSSWNTLDSITIDTLSFNNGSLWQFSAPGNMAYSPLFSGKVTVHDALDVQTVNSAIPARFSLDQNYPNPFNPTTRIGFELPRRSHVRLSVLNILGQHVRALVDEQLPAASYSVDWDGKSQDGPPVASGVYFYRIEADKWVQTRKMLLLK
ncbi:MAG: FlgD immunoglobulin-like domain containing protein, partial [Candidatus Zixiibacteriota bacterium]